MRRRLPDLDRFGSAVAALGDLDGDGVKDLAVGARGDDTGGRYRGAVHVLFLNANGTIKSLQKIVGRTGTPDLAAGVKFGSAVTSIGDLDGDGVHDLAVGAPVLYGVSRLAAVHVLFMRPDGTVRASQRLDNGTGNGLVIVHNDYFGHSVAAIGDLDGDGLTELAVGASKEGSLSGAVHVLFMNVDGTVKSRQKITHNLGGGPTLAERDRFGTAVASMGDLDGDGIGDLAVGGSRR